jgi:hypothetical protein
MIENKFNLKKKLNTLELVYNWQVNWWLSIEYLTSYPFALIIIKKYL